MIKKTVERLKCKPVINMGFNHSGKNHSKPDSGERRSRSFIFSLGLLNAFIMSVLTAVVLPFVENTTKAADESEYEVEGEIVCTQYFMDDVVYKTQKSSFTVSVSDDLWKVQIKSASNNPSSEVFSLVELGTDGANTYALSVFNPHYDKVYAIKENIQTLDRYIGQDAYEKIRPQLLASKKDLLRKLDKSKKNTLVPKQAQNQAVGNVYPINYPPNSRGDPSDLLWFAYCSHIYLKDTHQDVQLPRLWQALEMDQQTNQNMLPAHVVREAHAPRLPKYAVFSHDGMGLQLVENKLKRLPLKAPLDKGYTNAVFEVLRMTNVADLYFPHSFILSVYFPIKGVAVLATKTEAITTAVRTSCKQSTFVPYLPVAATIQDHRITEATNKLPVNYLAQSGPWNRTTNTTVLKHYQRNVMAAIKAKRQNRKYLITALLLGATISGFALLRCRSHTNSENSNQP